MFIEISQLQEFDSDTYEKVTKRWDTEQGFKALKHIEKLIQDGAGEDFLQYDVQNGILKGFLDNERDLKGINLSNIEVDCPKTDNFQGIDFSYSRFYNCHFNGCLFDATFLFTKFIDCTFEDCTFSNTIFKGSFFIDSQIKNVDFVNNGRIDNCEIENSKFSGYFFQRNLFSNCKIFNSSEIEKPQKFPNKNWGDLEFNYQTLADFYSALSLGYSESKAIEKSSEKRFLSRQAYTNYNTKSKLRKWSRYLINEKIAGYGEKPSFILRASFLLVLLSAILFLFSGFSIRESSKIINYNFNIFGFWQHLDNLNFYKSLASDFLASMFYSMKVFITIGSANVSTINIYGTIWVIIESFLGITFISSFAALLLRKITR